MKTHTKIINEIKVTAYRDSDVWVVIADGLTAQRFETKKWSMKDAMTFAAELAA